jgi:NCAIR mutase (PurE)-related protein
MTRIHETVGWLLSSLGVALLVCSLVLVPTSTAIGQHGGGGHAQAKCPGNSCSSGCALCDPTTTFCMPSQCPCMAAGVANCDKCECKIVMMGNACACGNK